MRLKPEEFKEQLEERTLNFAVDLLTALDELPARIILKVIVFQLAKSGSSIGANYREANRAESKDDFVHKLSIVIKEANETVYWLSILIRLKGVPQQQHESFKPLLVEAKELYSLFQSIGRSVRNNKAICKSPSVSPITQ